MRHIKGLESVDFTIQSDPLTDEERAVISEFIRDYKAANQATKPVIRKRASKAK